MNAFVDTNVTIGYTFLIDPLNLKSISVFDNYKYMFWSEYVENEYNKVFRSKNKILIRFYEDLLRDLEKGLTNDFSLDKLKNHVVKKYSYKDNNKKIKHINSSLDSFWYNYIDEKYPSIESLIFSINNCINDLNHGIRTRKSKLLTKIKKTNKRTEKYLLLNNKLLDKGIHKPDNKIVLDAYDFNLKTDFDLDFITFDKILYKGSIALNNELKFNKILGLNDFSLI